MELHTLSTRKHKVFVYGTLRNSHAATHRLEGYNLYKFEGGTFPFPSVRRAQEGQATGVLGNLLTVSDAELAELDLYEGIEAGLYTRETVRVQEIGIAGSNIEAYVYVGTDLIFPPQIQSGDWASR